ncbi:hypothetical protein AGOR_G00082060 [Albula goreensis]|uniref:Uncharacterized protein n=1 Tax=Albula goreensis TaxID=1534307 RepID=A0A8T3DMT0_9TELE|nr:hypothetical protein AGOR_G00082060 [Albula goreensis]
MQRKSDPPVSLTVKSKLLRKERCQDTQGKQQSQRFHGDRPKQTKGASIHCWDSTGHTLQSNHADTSEPPVKKDWTF